MGFGRLSVTALSILLLPALVIAQEDAFIPGTGAAPQHPAGAGSDKVADTLARLIEENTRLRSELAEKQKQIDALLAQLAQNAPGAAAGSAAVVAAAEDDSDAKSQARAVSAATKGPWSVRVISNEEPTALDLQQQLTEAQSKILDIDARLSEAKSRRDAVLGSTQVLTQTYHDRYGNYRGSGQTTRRTFTVEEQGQVRVAVQKIEGERRRAAQNVARLERQIADAGKSRLIVGQLDDGTSVEITTQGEAAMRISRQMAEGEHYKVTGTGSAEGGVLKIKMTGAIGEGGGAKPHGPAVSRPGR